MEKTLTLNDIDERLKQIILILAQQTLITNLKDATQREKIAFLGKTGLSNTDIAELLNTTTRVVTVELSAIRKTPKKSNGKKAK